MTTTRLNCEIDESFDKLNNDSEKNPIVSSSYSYQEPENNKNSDSRQSEQSNQEINEMDSKEPQNNNAKDPI
ncbi:17082_t:CDS:2 [Cetraspora pellucida]|uniref:17082_t:CDS:1 n=1 Tax=Cetraspora pellucida TaxID=1433469 RepID=A0A9N9J103_9GLOM|nr:17082_t:CDS:2 [Cetraspora pellucida]